MKAIDPPWLVSALHDVGQRETDGPNNSPWIRAMLQAQALQWLLGQPWCGNAMGKWVQEHGIRPPKNYFRARAWLDWGIPLDEPVRGAVVVLSRKGSASFAHVGTVAGKDQRGRLMVVGGNQSDAVSIAPFDMSRVLGYRWPIAYADLLYRAGSLPLIASGAASSVNEA